ncbi:MAG: serine acetyltransferase [Clostridia bacterium]|nr:serine acetyltransferase [Clostridia bacterium]
MNTKHDFDSAVAETAQKLTLRSEKQAESINRSGLKAQVETLLQLLRSAMYPRIFGDCGCENGYMKDDIRIALHRSALLLYDILRDLYPQNDAERTNDTVCEFIAGLDDICALTETDVKAAYEGDPAARSETEIMLAYPAFEAISIYRIAHRLYLLGAELIARMMTEYAHRLTGIDIHPGAEIGEYFFIDHGTGVVIGETCTIKDHVKLYQGVTLGALSFKLDENGNPIKGIKRHPDIGSHVIIYAGATILGGDTKIGDNSIVGSNAWITQSVPEGSKVFYTKKD